MQVEQVMSQNVYYIPSTTSLSDAASSMRDHDTGFLPIGDDKDDRLKGVVTDRDIVVRGLAAGHNPQETTVADVKTDKVLYCYKADDIRDAAKSMREQQVYRLIVLDNKESKRLCGIISLGDIVQNGKEKLGGHTADGIMSH